MKTSAEVTAEKLRGGFYTPPDLVRACIERVSILLGTKRAVRVLEPSAGDGAFIHRLAESELRDVVEAVVGVELLPEEAAKAREALATTGLPGAIHCGSAIAWAIDSSEQFDVAIGNPPFVRFQFLSPDDKLALRGLGEKLNVAFGGVSNLWIPILLGALERLRPGGAAAFVIPTECLTGISAGVVRKWLAAHLASLQLDLFEPGSFPGVLQEVLVMSGCRRSAVVKTGRLRIVEHFREGRSRAWAYDLPVTSASWSRYLLDPVHLEALDLARKLPGIHVLHEVASIEVSIVTGANDYFSVDNGTLDQFDLGRWARPLLPRVRNAPGIVYGGDDQRATADGSNRSWLLHFAEGLPDPEEYEGASRYLRAGESLELHKRYKCRIRTPWYRVPSIKSGRLLLSKRSHRYHRLILNEAQALTTDTIYRGWMRPTWHARASDLVAGFHNSLTLLTAEVEGRSFGGGVLELVPSEIGRLAVPLIDGLGQALGQLDQASRGASEDALVEVTDELLASKGALPPDVLSVLQEARDLLLNRRLDRNARSTGAEVESLAA